MLYLRALAAASLLLLPGAVLPDHIYLKDGRVVKDVRIVQISDTAVTYKESEIGPALSIPRALLQRVQYARVDWKLKELELKRAALAEKQSKLEALKKANSENPVLILRQQIARLSDLEARMDSPGRASPGFIRQDLAGLRAELERAESLLNQTDRVQTNERETSQLQEQLARDEAAHKTSLQQEKLRNSAARSMLLPGWGQLSDGQMVRGTAWLSLFAVMTVKTRMDYSNAMDAYVHYRDPLPFYLLQSQGSSGQILGNMYYSERSTELAAARRQVNTDLSILGLIWVGSLIDVLFFRPTSGGLSLELEIRPPLPGAVVSSDPGMAVMVRLPW